jgi:hypothetical protein
MQSSDNGQEPWVQALFSPSWTWNLVDVSSPI